MAHDPDLTPEQQREVTRRLADARHTEPLPVDVAARLDEVLARLDAGEDVATSPAPIDLAAHQARRRRRVTRLLVAAAAVVVVGVGAAQVVPELTPAGSGDASESTSDAGAEAAGSAGSGADPSQTAPATEDRADTESDAEAADGLLESAQLAVPGVRRLTERDFTGSVSRVRDEASAAARRVDAFAAEDDGSEELAGPSNDSSLNALAERSARRAARALAEWDVCESADWGPGLLVRVRYAGEPAVLAFRSPAGDTQVVDLLQCGTAEVLRSVTLPRR